MKQTQEKTLFISYRWNDGTKYADELQAQLRGSFRVLRDKTELGTNDDIYEFMQKIIECDFVIIVLTGEYVRALNCMLELSILSAEPDWRHKAFVLVIDDSIYQLDKKIEILSYWKMQQKIMRVRIADEEEGKELLSKELEYIDTICERAESALGEITRFNNPSQIAIVNEVVKKSKIEYDISKEISERESRVTEYMKNKKGCTIKSISEQLGISQVAIRRTMDNLIKKGKVEKTCAGSKMEYVFK